MNEKELYKQKYQAQLDEWAADIAKMKAKAAGAKAGAQIAMNKEVDSLELRLKDAQAKLSAFAVDSEEALGSVKKGMESAWDSLKTGINNAASKFKD